MDWGDPVRQPVCDTWLQWRHELTLLADKSIPCCYFPNTARITSFQLHSFLDASELAYAGGVYLRMTDSSENVHVAVCTSKTKVTPIKRLTIPRLELCGAQLLAQLLYHVREALHIPAHDVYASTILFLAGWKGALVTLKLTLVTVFHASLNKLHPARGIM